MALAVRTLAWTSIQRIRSRLGVTASLDFGDALYSSKAALYFWALDTSSSVPSNTWVNFAMSAASTRLDHDLWLPMPFFLENLNCSTSAF